MCPTSFQGLITRISFSPYRRRFLTAIIMGFLLTASTALPAAEAGLPPYPVASEYRRGQNLAEYWVSEKLDGVRGHWNGEALLLRSGNRVQAPAWFTATFPDTALDGELWLGRGRFDEISGLLRRLETDAAGWREVMFMVFDLPDSPLPFDQRQAALRELTEDLRIPWLRAIVQTRVANEEALQTELARVVALGGEGLMLHRGSALYRQGRPLDLMKLKPAYDAEAVVLRHLPGRGRLRGMMGSLLVETADGVRFRLGTGFTDAERRDPPPIGSLVTFEYSGLTPAGVPRFARFLRMREEF